MRGFLRWSVVFLMLGGLGQAAENDERSRIPPTHVEEGILIKPCDAIGKGTAQPSFRTDIPCIEVSVDLVHISSPHTLRFLYYQPDGNLYGTTSPDWSFGPEAGGQGYHRLAHITHRLAVKGEEAGFRIGTWKVSVWLDELHLAETRFQLDRPPLPLEQNLTEAQELYRNGEYQKAVDRLNTVINSVHHTGIIAESAWWLALSQQAMGRAEDADAALMKLLQTDATYGPSAGSMKAEGADQVLAQLEAVRKREFLDLYVKSVDVPKVELTKSEEAPVLGRRWPLWKKLLIYGGIPVAAAATTVLLVGGSETVIPGPPTVSLDVGDAARRDTVNRALCTDEVIPVQLTISGGVPPFDAIFLASRVIENPSRPIRVGSVVQTLTTNRVVLLRASFTDPGAHTVSYPAFVISPDVPGIAGINLSVVVKDAESSVSFDAATPGQTLPGSISGSVGTDARVLDQSTSDVLIQGGRDC